VVLSLGIGLSAFMFSLAYGVVLAVICSVGFFASWIPAKRATSVDPVNALRYD
jgi:ABC-type antimicrobial peptide transport system permease subunit